MEYNHQQKKVRCFEVVEEEKKRYTDFLQPEIWQACRSLPRFSQYYGKNCL